jgi:branched-chain amino acid transport system substrate-binding protein
VFRTSVHPGQLDAQGGQVHPGQGQDAGGDLPVNNDFGKGGRDTLVKLLANGPTKVISDISTDQRPGGLLRRRCSRPSRPTPTRCSSTLNEEESARALRELRKQGYNKPIVGETVLISQKVIELAGDAANGATGHVGLTVDAPSPADAGFKGKFYQAYQVHPGPQRHQGLHGRVRRSRPRSRRSASSTARPWRRR